MGNPPLCVKRKLLCPAAARGAAARLEAAQQLRAEQSQEEKTRSGHQVVSSAITIKLGRF